MNLCVASAGPGAHLLQTANPAPVAIQPAAMLARRLASTCCKECQLHITAPTARMSVQRMLSVLWHAEAASFTVTVTVTLAGKDDIWKPWWHEALASSPTLKPFSCACIVTTCDIHENYTPPSAQTQWTLCTNRSRPNCCVTLGHSMKP